MADPQIEKLLILQDHDIALQRIEQELAQLPTEQAKIERLIKEEIDNLEAAGQALKAKEVARSELDQQVKSMEAEVARYKNQQLEVKKNDEYRALTQQSEQCESEISQLEEKEIKLLLEIDTAREAYEAEKRTIEERIARQRKEITQLAERAQSLKASIDKAKEAQKAACGGIEPDYLEQYGRVKKLVKRAPYLAPIRDHKCGGCHLRVSNEVSRGAMDAGEPHFCDQCARMVYV